MQEYVAPSLVSRGKRGPKPVDHTSKRYGQLVGLRRVGSHNGAVWVWQCDCGQEKIASASNVVGGRTVSCGCIKPQAMSDFTGRRYGYLTALVEGTIDGTWEWECDCGNTFTTYPMNVVNGKVLDCGGCGTAERGGVTNDSPVPEDTPTPVTLTPIEPLDEIVYVP